MTGRADCLRRNHDVPQCRLSSFTLAQSVPNSEHTVSGLGMDRLVQLTNIRFDVIRLQLALGWLPSTKVHDAWSLRLLVRP
jgi:hypothetical protein